MKLPLCFSNSFIDLGVIFMSLIIFELTFLYNAFLRLGCSYFPGGSDDKASAYNMGGLGFSLGQEDPLEKEMATHSSTLAWKIPWTEEPGRLQSMGSQIVRQDWATKLSFPFNPLFSTPFVEETIMLLKRVLEVLGSAIYVCYRHKKHPSQRGINKIPFFASNMIFKRKFKASI